MNTASSPSDPWRSGPVTRSSSAWSPGAQPAPGAESAAEPASAGEPASETDEATGLGRRRLRLLLFGGVAGTVLAAGVVVLLTVVLTGREDPLRRAYAPPPEDRPPLAQLCPPPDTAPASPAPASPGPASPGPAAPAPSGPRTIDRESGISYRQYGEPWLPWGDRWSGGTLQVVYAVGQHFVTERYPGGEYHASILSGRVPATFNDSTSFDLECTGRQVAADVRASYYPQPNQLEPVREQRRLLGGLPAWVTTFRLNFSVPRLTATSELVGVAVIDLGGPQAAILYVSIPNTHARLNWVVEDAIASVRRA